MDDFFLKRSLELARIGSDQGDGGPFGAVIVCAGEIVGEGWNRVVRDHDPTAHAEIVAIRAACARLQCFHLADCVLYASSEPCPMCLSAAYWAHIQRIVFSNPRSVAAEAGFCDDALYQELRLSHDLRTIPTTHLSLPGAEDVFKRWQQNPLCKLY